MWLLFGVCLCLCWSISVGASAQEPDTETAGQATAPAKLSYEEYRLSELEYLAKRSRNAMIGTSAVTAVGIALITPAAVNECVRVASSNSFDDLRCTSTGRVLLGIGVPFAVVGGTGLLVTAIMFGVRKGRIKSIEDRLAYEGKRALRWDPARGAFAF